MTMKIDGSFRRLLVRFEPSEQIEIRDVSGHVTQVSQSIFGDGLQRMLIESSLDEVNRRCRRG